jgi:hypothetical protein
MLWTIVAGEEPGRWYTAPFAAAELCAVPSALAFFASSEVMKACLPTS